ncbi:MAG: sigma-54 dependent transcriptional regulator [Candidatus Muirbacterium halophilum]|nr:sigma-54 dependent transcriptional regulator [Candidatus Muirbacterium halophilum]MCK9475928.1 sigma-54 dependent transcriptional regulator [Candidatus Muirbacterium halophilum]
MKNILITWIGNRDPYSDKKIKGPVLSLLNKKKFDIVYVFHAEELSDKAYNLKEIYKNENINIINKKIILNDPRDYSEIFINVKSNIEEILNENKKSEFSVYIDPGTAQMKTVWIMLKLAGLLPAYLIQGTEPQYNNGVYKFSEIHIDNVCFPGINIDSKKENINQSLQKFKKNKKLLHDKFSDIIGEHPEMLKCFEYAGAISGYDESVLITGESGTGKELFARKIHDLSNRKNNNFVSINCAAIPESIFESELFGYEKGAFTGAVISKKGLIEEASGGTLFLDEIGEMPLFFQAKLLRILQDGKFLSVGSTKEKKVDFRLVTATNRNLIEFINKGRFREDLYHRLTIVTIKIPPLRERRSDIVLLIKFFMEKYNKEYIKNSKLSEEIYEKMLSYSWSGNVRELENTIKRLLIISESAYIDNIDLLPESIRINKKDHYKDYLEIRNSKNLSVDDYIKNIEKDIYNKSLSSFDNNVSKTAEFLKVKSHTLRKRIEKI